MNATWWRPVLTVVLFSALPFAVFLNSNRADLDPEAALGLYALFLLVPGIAAVLVGPLCRCADEPQSAPAIAARMAE